MLVIKELFYKNILQNVNFSCEKGKIYGIFGPSGSGKTTLLKIIKNFTVSWTGQVTYKGENIDLYNKSIGYTLQDSVFFNSLTIMNNLRLTGATDKEIYNMVNEMNLSHFLQKDLKHLSGGEKQRLSICRCLLLKPTVLLMDEPISALDFENVEFILKYIKSMVIDQGIICLMVSHNINNMNIYDYIIQMNSGMITNIIKNDQ